MLSMIQQSARKTLNVNRIGVADSKLATLKFGTTAKTSNVLSLIRGNSAPATNIKANLTLSNSNDTTDNATPAINSTILKFGNAAQEHTNDVLGMLDDTNASTKANIDLPATLADKSQKLKDATNGDGNWGGNYQSDLLDDASTTFTGTTSLPQMDLDSITQPSSAGAMTDRVDELNKAKQNDPWIASAKAMVEQANQQSPGVTQLLQ